MSNLPTIAFKHIAVGSRFAEKGILGERRYEKLTETTARLIGHDHPSFEGTYGLPNGLGRINDFGADEQVQPLNHQ